MLLVEWLKTPIPKTPRPAEPADYRPIALTSTLCKVFERILARKILDCTAKLWQNNRQYGFLPGHNTMDAIIKVVEDWSRAKDQQLPTTAIFFDFSKAFDLVDHEILLSKLSQLWPEWITSWIAAYLTNRTQRVKTGDIFSEWKPVEAGVIQGSILGPILFLIFILDINHHVPNGVELIKYADDLLTYVSSSTWQCELIQGAANGIENWCQINKKCLEMVMSNGHLDPCPPTTLAG